ncbi:stomatal closure-related actin-binding protein 1-like [Gossypium hirsutum]|uniref:Stomatal closure-related actin-binding protein 1-like n=1 Tax=Gossypium hirsutum TaxID=3635 RepID=A0A1U8JK56_GOSHI|nr:stomatal closure-related actin-binding protein 1-like [Gossypium hirsutum]
MQKEAFPAVSTDVIFALSYSLNYKIGANDHIANVKGDPKVSSMKEIVAHETKGLIVVAKLFEKAKLREAASLGKHFCLKKLKDALESLKRYVTQRNEDDVEEVIAMLEALEIELTQRGELIQEKAELEQQLREWKSTLGERTNVLSFSEIGPERTNERGSRGESDQNAAPTKQDTEHELRALRVEV